MSTVKALDTQPLDTQPRKGNKENNNFQQNKAPDAEGTIFEATWVAVKIIHLFCFVT